MVVTLQRLELCANRVKDVREMFEVFIQFASWNTTVIFTDNDLFLGSKPYNGLFLRLAISEIRRLTTSMWIEGQLSTSCHKSTISDLGINV